MNLFQVYIVISKNYVTIALNFSFYIGVEAVLSWKTTKELLSFPQHLNGKYLISFMEKNGLKHGDFIIPSTINVCKSFLVKKICIF